MGPDKEDEGNTYGNDELLMNTEEAMTKRIDYQLYKGKRKAKVADVIGEELDDRTPGLIWPSDHAGVYVEYSLESCESDEDEED